MADPSQWKLGQHMFEDVVLIGLRLRTYRSEHSGRICGSWHGVGWTAVKAQRISAAEMRDSGVSAREEEEDERRSDVKQRNSNKSLVKVVESRYLQICRLGSLWSFV